MKSASPFILVKNVRESVDYYQSLFGGDIHILNEHAGKLLHAELHLGSSLIHFADTYGRKMRRKMQMSLCNLTVKTKFEKCTIT